MNAGKTALQAASCRVKTAIRAQKKPQTRSGSVMTYNCGFGPGINNHNNTKTRSSAIAGRPYDAKACQG